MRSIYNAGQTQSEQRLLFNIDVIAHTTKPTLGLGGSVYFFLGSRTS